LILYMRCSGKTWLYHFMLLLQRVLMPGSNVKRAGVCDQSD
jgi:hypothetical protein